MTLTVALSPSSPAERGASPSRGRQPLRVAVVGLGGWGQRLLAALCAHPDVRVVAACDQDLERLGAAELALGGVHAADARPDHGEVRFCSVRFCSGLSEVLGDSTVRAVVVAVDPAANGAVALQALRAGKHVLVEKPAALELSVARQLVDTARERGLVACEGHLLRYHPAHEQLAALVGPGAELGTALRVFGERTGPHRPRAVSPWWVLAPHDASLLVANLGPAREVAVHETGARSLAAQVLFAAGARARLSLGEGPPRRRFTLLAERGLAIVDELEAPRCVRVAHTRGSALLGSFDALPAAQLDAELRRVAQASAVREVSVSGAQPLQAQLAAFVAAARRAELGPEYGAGGDQGRVEPGEGAPGHGGSRWSLALGESVRTPLDASLPVTALLAAGETSRLGGGAAVAVPQLSTSPEAPRARRPARHERAAVP